MKSKKTKGYDDLEDCVTLGDHVKRMRLKRGLQQIEVAPVLGINPWTLRNWERKRTEPLVRHYPAIMKFLGYCPYQRAEGLGRKIMLHRTHEGLTQKAFARQLKVDPGTVARWEAGDSRPTEKIARQLASAFGFA
ncbi:MAG: transcriptional regulator [Candidatus Thiodiazotropha lotti]|nr:transcriptional regulator [Candidatus Thiodiazotropha lotti]